MRIFNQEKTKELFNPDLSIGYLISDNLLIAHHDAVERKVIKSASQIAAEYREQGKEVNLRYDDNWYVVTTVYENGGIDEEPIDDIVEEGKDAYDEYEDIQVYVPYTKQQLVERQIDELKKNLADTDYQAIKYAEGLISEYDYAKIKNQRQSWREEINRLELIVQSYA